MYLLNHYRCSTSKLILLERITINPNVLKGKPTILNMRFTVHQLLEILAAGMATEEVLQDYPFLEREDILSCLQFAARMVNTKDIIPLAS